MRGKSAAAGVVTAAVLAMGGANAGAETSGPELAAGTLNLRAELRVVSQLGACPAGVDASTCSARTGRGPVPGLGNVTEAYTFAADIGPPACAGGFGKTRASVVTLAVAGKGEVGLALSEAAECFLDRDIFNQTQAFTVTGGSGIYAGASGSGIVERKLATETTTGRIGREIWTGTLNVPGLDFDVTAPTLTGAVGKKVRAPRGVGRVRVTYAVSARDDVDGAVPVSCSPRSGFRFVIGRTLVTCSATDTSGNTQTARFTITVQKGR